MESEKYILNKLKENDPKITKLVWASLNPKINNQDIQYLSDMLLRNTYLVHLTLTSNNIGPLGAKLLADIKSLRYLFTSNNKIGNQGAKYLAQANHLIALSIATNDIDDEGTIEFSKNTSLTSLNIGFNKISNNGVKMLSQMKNLKYLDLTHNLIDDIGTEYIACQFNLKEVKIRRNKLTDKGIINLAKNDQIISLDISNNAISDLSLKFIAEHKQLINFEIPREASEMWIEKIKNNIQTNKKRVDACKVNFVQLVIILARNKVNTNLSVTHNEIINDLIITKLPLELLLHIVTFLDFVEMAKTKEQIYGCAKFIFEHINELNDIINNKQSIKIIESIYPLRASERYRFFTETLPTNKVNQLSDDFNQAVEIMKKKFNI